MAAITKMFRVFKAHRQVVIILYGMAINAFFKAVFFRANAIMNGFITLVQNHFHMVCAHEAGFFNAFITLAFGNIRRGDSRVSRQANQH
jgi:hypothetical protein